QVVFQGWVSGFVPLAMGQWCLATGDREPHVRWLQEASALADRNGNTQVKVLAQMAQAEGELVQGHLQAARARLRPLLELPDRREDDLTLLLPLLAWAELESDEREHTEEGQCEALLAQSVARATTQHYRLALVDALRIQGLLATRQERWEGAEAALEE